MAGGGSCEHSSLDEEEGGFADEDFFPAEGMVWDPLEPQLWGDVEPGEGFDTASEYEAEAEDSGALGAAFVVAGAAATEVRPPACGAADGAGAVFAAAGVGQAQFLGSGGTQEPTSLTLKVVQVLGVASVGTDNGDFEYPGTLGVAGGFAAGGVCGSGFGMQASPPFCKEA